MSKRVTVRVPKGVLEDVERLVEDGEYGSVSDAFREGVTRLDGVGEHRRLATDGGRPEDESGPPSFPPHHPLHGHEHKMVDHEGHLQAFSDALNDVDADDIHGVMFAITTENWTETFPTIHGDANAQQAAFQMLAANISHVAAAMQADPRSVAEHALHTLDGMMPDPEVYGDD